jgi:hypothetical protein
VNAADLDGDGDRELIGVANGTNEILVFFQEPAGEYGPPLQLEGGTRLNPVNDFFNSVNSVTVCDLDLNGELDLVGTQSRFQHLVTYYQTRPGQFGLIRELGSPDDFAELGEKGQPVALFRSAGVADLDRDGVMEVLASGGDGALHVYDTDKNGELVTVPEMFVTGGGRSMMVLDVDGDGVQESVCYSDASSGELVATRVNPSGQLETRSLVAIPNVMGLGSFTLQGAQFQFFDFDLDGDLDLLSMRPSAGFGVGVVEIREQLAPGVFAQTPSLELAPGFADASAVYVEDIDGDGQPDLLLPRSTLGSGDVSIVWGGR